jgi:ammonia channel protein AmtB
MVGIGWAGKLKGVGANSVGIALGVMVAGLGTWGLLAGMRRFTKLRVSEAAEYDGLDLAEHDQNAYPDFQQTMIKSYHLREA